MWSPVATSPWVTRSSFWIEPGSGRARTSLMAMTTRPPRPAASPPLPNVPAPVAAETGAFWGAISALRGGRRSLHPIGDSYEATFVVPKRRNPLGADLLDQPGERR